MLNDHQMEELFDRECVLICGRDAVPEARAVELLGIDAVRSAKLHKNMRNPDDKEYYGDGSDLYRVWVLPDGGEVRFWLLRGFDLIVTYHNVYLQAEKEAAASAAGNEETT